MFLTSVHTAKGDRLFVDICHLLTLPRAYTFYKGIKKGIKIYLYVLLLSYFCPETLQFLKFSVLNSQFMIWYIVFLSPCCDHSLFIQYGLMLLKQWGDVFFYWFILSQREWNNHTIPQIIRENSFPRQLFKV